MAKSGMGIASSTRCSRITLRSIRATNYERLRTARKRRGAERAPLASGPPCYRVIGTSSSDTRRTRHGRLPDILAKSPEPWRQRHCRSSSGEVQNAESPAPRRMRTSRYGRHGDSSDDIEPARATRHWHCPAPAIAKVAPLLLEQRVEQLPRQRLRPVS
jgi:hypothetical protein